MNAIKPQLFNASVAVGATALAAVNSSAATTNITSATLNVVSINAGNDHYGVMTYDPGSFAITGRVGGQPVNTYEIAVTSGYYPGKDNFGNQLLGINPGFSQLSTTTLAAGQAIGMDTIWTLYDNFSPTQSDTYYGVRFDAGSGNYNYGWVEVNTAFGTEAIIVAAGVENTPNLAIFAGQTAPVPEPSSLALLALAGGSVALVARRQNRRATVTR